MNSKRLLICNIEKENGYYRFRNTYNDFLESNFDLTSQSDDNLNTIEDIVISIVDEKPELVLFFLTIDNEAVIKFIVVSLIENTFTDIVLYDLEKRHSRNLLIGDRQVEIITELEQLTESTAKIKYGRKTGVESIDFQRDRNPYFKSVNQLIANYTGRYQFSSYITNILTLEVLKPDIKISKNIYERLLNINGMLLYNMDEILLEQQETQKQSSFCDVCRVGKKAFLLENSNYSTLFKVSDYKNYESDTQILRIQDKEDFGMFLEDVEEFGSNGHIREYNAQLENTCAWMYHGCQLSKACRCSLDENGDLQACHSSRMKIGKSTDNFYQLMSRASQLKEEVIEEKQCTGCSARFYCSKCIAIIKGFIGGSYCNAVKSNPCIHQYLVSAGLLRKITQKSTTIPPEIAPFLKISNIQRTLVFQEEVDVHQYNWNNNLFAFLLNGKYYILSHKCSQIIKIDERIIFIAEALTFGKSMNEMIKLYSKRYLLDEKTAVKQMKDGLLLIRKYKFV